MKKMKFQEIFRKNNFPVFAKHTGMFIFAAAMANVLRIRLQKNLVLEG